ncbi:hypothetical protein [Streptomyces sp. NPDC058086]|uniref:hypothetical protein n=1 Tax=Streptomyces sp. NPDC058086 TaxID=3346334 RepID=UPI0036EC3C0F
MTEVIGGPLDALAARHGVTELNVTEARSLSEPSYPRVKRFVRVVLPPGQTYRTADHLAVLPANDPALVERAAKLLDADLDTVLNIASTRPRPDGFVLDLLPPIRPRTYSVSSSQSTASGHVDLIVSLLEAPARSGRGTHPGTGSRHLNTVRVGDVVLARRQPCREAFRITHDDRTPVIVIAAGTGLAPFRGAIADRLGLAESGARLAPALCYFGCDAPDADYLLAEEAGAKSSRPASIGRMSWGTAASSEP